RERHVNGLLLAARWPLRPLALRRAPVEPRRWLLGSVAVPQSLGGALAVGALHAPNVATGRKLPYLDALRDVVVRWRGGPGLLVGDTNTGRMEVDEQSRV